MFMLSETPNNFTSYSQIEDYIRKIRKHIILDKIDVFYPSMHLNYVLKEFLP